MKLHLGYCMAQLTFILGLRQGKQAYRRRRKPRFLLRNKRRSQLHEEQVRQLFEQKRIGEQNSGAIVTVSATEAKPMPSEPTIFCDSPTSNNNNNSWSKRIPERLGTPQMGLAEQYAFNDRDEINTIASNGRCFVTSKNLKLLKYGAVRRAKKTHCRVTQTKYAQFQIFVNKWLQQYVSDQQQQHCLDWLLGRTAEQNNSSGMGISCKTKLMHQKDTSRTPYRVFPRYKVTQATPAITNTSMTNTSAAEVAPTATVSTSSAGATSTITVSNISTTLTLTETVTTSSISGSSSCRSPPQQHCSSASAATVPSKSETALQQVRPMES